MSLVTFVLIVIVVLFLVSLVYRPFFSGPSTPAYYGYVPSLFLLVIAIILLLLVAGII